MSDPNSPPNEKKSFVKLTFLDRLGRGIPGLKYQVGEGEIIFIRGITNDKGEGRSFASIIGASLDFYVERFESGEMKKIKSVAPTTGVFSVKLFSNKIKETMTLEAAQGNPGTYRRKTQIAGTKGDHGYGEKESKVSYERLSKPNGLDAGSTLRGGEAINSAKSQPSTGMQTVHSVDTGGQASKDPDRGSSSTSVLRNATREASIQSVPIEKLSNRGSNGTPKTSLTMLCAQNACIKLGASNPLIEEINVRLTGFGGIVGKNTEIDKFTAYTEMAVRNFQRDYMDEVPTGKVCASFLHALDEFRIKFPISLHEMKCPCGKCGGFGKKRTNGESVNIYDAKKPVSGIEYPGMHRGLLWLFRASLFYTSVKKSALGFNFLGVASGYRCWDNNKINGRTSVNHMGNALDLHFRFGKSGIRCEGENLETLRDEIFVKCLGAHRRWKVPYSAALEEASDGAKSWVHVDVRNFCEKFKADKFYAFSQEGVDGEPLIILARRLGLLSLINCGGIAAPLHIESVGNPHQEP